jgi:hypothetical protein
MGPTYVMDLAGLREEDYEHCSILLGGSGRQVLPSEDLLEAKGVEEVAAVLDRHGLSMEEWQQGHFLFVIRWGDDRVLDVVRLLEVFQQRAGGRVDLTGVIGRHIHDFHHFRRLTPEEMEEFEVYDDPETASNSITLDWDAEDAERKMSVLLSARGPLMRIFAKVGDEYYTWHGGMELP